MQRTVRTLVRTIAGVGLTLSLVTPALFAQAAGRAPGDTGRRRPCDSLCIDATRTVKFETTEGTWMNVDVSPDGRTILFDLLGDIYSVSIDGGKAQRLTSGMAWDVHAVFSPDGKRIAYVSDRSGSENLWLMDADGSKQKALTKARDQGFSIPEWSPDGDYILTRRQAANGTKAWLYHKDGGSGNELSKDVNGMGHVWSPNGRYVYFTSAGFGGGSGLGSVTGKQLRRLDRETGDVATLTDSPVGAFRPRISPDGKWVVYGSRVDAETGLRLRNLENDDDTWLMFPIDRDEAEGFAAGDHLPRFDYLPDGSAIVIATRGTFHRVDLKTKQATKIPFSATVEQQLGPLVLHKVKHTNDAVPVKGLRYAGTNPDRSKLVFGALSRLWMMDFPNGTPRRIAADSGGQFQPVFSPDGQSIAFVSWDDLTGGHVWRMPANGGAPTRLTTAPGYYMHPSWSPDGSKIAFIREDPAAARNVWSRNTGMLHWIPSTGGASVSVGSAPSDNRVSFTSDGNRIAFIRGTELISVRLDGTDRKTIAKFTTTDGASVSEAVPSPDGKWLAFTVREDLFLGALPATLEVPTFTEASGPGPFKRITREGGIDVRWDPDGRSLSWVFGNKFSRVNRDSAIADRPASDSLGGKPQTITIALTAPRATPSGSVVLRGAKVITMKGQEVIDNADVVVTDNRIAAVGRQGSVPIPAGARRIDARGKFIAPGFIDMHAHLRAPRDVFVQSAWPYLANLAFGVTTARDVSSSNDEFFYSELIETGDMLGPRIYSTGRAMLPGNVKVENLEDARAFVRHYKELGAVVLKQYAQPHRRQRQWLLQAAHEQGLNITNEGGGDAWLDLTMVLDGFSGFEHSLPLGNLYNDVIQLVAQSKSWYTPTLVVSYGGPASEWYFYQSTNVHDDAKLNYFTPHETIDRRTRRGQLNLLDEYHFVNVAKGAAAIMKAGGNVAMGAHGEEQGICAHWEIWSFQMGGMSNYDALRTATSVAAEGLGMLEDLGTIEAGKLADLIVLDRNPLENIRNTNSVRMVMKNGELYDASTLAMIWPKERALRPFKFRDYSKPGNGEK